MARPTISQRIALEGGEQIKRALADLGKAGEDAFGKLQKAGEKVSLSGPASAVEAATRRAGTTVDELRQRMASAGGAAAQSGAGFAQFGGVVQATQQRLVTATNAGAQVGLAIRGIGTAFSGAIGRVQEFGSGVTGALQSMSTTALKSAVTLAAVPTAFFAIANSAAEAAAKIKEASIAAGTSPQEYQKLVIAAEQMGGSEEKLVLALSIVNEKVHEQSQNVFANQKRLQDLRETMLKGGLAGRQAAEDFQGLKREMELFGPSASRSGESIIDVQRALKNLGPSNVDAIERLKGLADEIADLETPAERSARVIEVFGRRLGPQLVELLSGGRKAIEDMGKRAEDLGLIMDDVQFKIAKDMTDALALMRRGIAATKNSIGILFAPAIIEAAELFTEAIARNRTDLILWASEIAAKVRPVLLDLVRALTGDTEAITTGWIRNARQLIIDLGAAIANVTQTIIVPAFQAFMAVLQTVAETINGLFGTKLTAADVGVVLLLAKMVGAFTLLAGVLRLVGGALGALRGAFAMLTGAGNVLLIAMRALGGMFGIIRVAVAGLIATFGAVPIAIAAVGAAIGFLAVRLAQAVDWSAFAERARAAFGAILGFVTGLGVALGGQFLALLQLGSSLWNGILAVAQAAFLGIIAGVVALWIALRTVWQSGVAALGALWDAVAAAARAAFEPIVAGADTLWVQVLALWQTGTEAIGVLCETLKSTAQLVWQAITDGVSGAWTSISSLWSAGIERLIGFLTRLRDFAIGVWNAIAAAAQRAFGAEQQAAAGAGGFARGGPVFGAGTATSDSIPAWLSNGEFVVRAAAVRKYGLSLFSALNGMRVDPGAFQRFAEGGLVRSLQVLMPRPIRFAEGGLVPQPASTTSLRPISLTIGADTFAGLLAPEDVAQRLMQVAVGKQIRSAGRRPGYYGSGR